MTSYYTEHGLSKQTLDAYRLFGASPRSTAERLNFYIPYLTDVVPNPVSVLHVPSHLQAYDIGGTDVRREEIQLGYAGKIFMTCVVSMDMNPQMPEQIAGHLAFLQWGQGFFVRDSHRAWRMVTAAREMRFCSSRDGREWDRTATAHPINDVEAVVAHFKREFESVCLR